MYKTAKGFLLYCMLMRGDLNAQSSNELTATGNRIQVLFN